MARIFYPEDRARGLPEKTGTLVYCQMAITDQDPLEIQHIRNRFPAFPNEPTTNQFYTDQQVDAYRNLGYHIAGRLSSEMERWKTDGCSHPRDNQEGQPYFDELIRRLQTSYHLACHQEVGYRDDDIHAEAVWVRESKGPVPPVFNVRLADRPTGSEGGDAGEQPTRKRELVINWLWHYQTSATLRSHYRIAVTADANQLSDRQTSECLQLWRRQILEPTRKLEHSRGGMTDPMVDIVSAKPPEQNQSLLLSEGLVTCHLAAMAIACHEMHHGRPSEVLQIGGRDRLVGLMGSLAEAIASRQGGSLGSRCIAELLELQHGTFQGSEQATGISFSMILMMMLGAARAPGRSADAPQAGVTRVEGAELKAANLRGEMVRALNQHRFDVFARCLDRAYELGQGQPPTDRSKSSKPNQPSQQNETAVRSSQPERSAIDGKGPLVVLQPSLTSAARAK